tara:strand:- start:706 stop:1122 length:417 start_codon:yes stop_codon:yes gene_type:complete
MNIFFHIFCYFFSLIILYNIYNQSIFSKNMNKKDPGFMDMLFKRLNIQSFNQFILVMIVFAITGSLSLIVTFEFINAVGINSENTSPYLFWPVRIIFLFFSYQILLLLVAIPFRQFKYFWNFEKKILSRLGVRLNSDH